MSSILKALKKIESRKAETQLPTWPYRINNRESISRHTNRTWRRHKVLGILIVVFAVALAGKLYFANRPNLESMAPGTDLSARTALPDLSAGEVKSDRLRAEAATKPMPSPPAIPREVSPDTTMDTSPAEFIIKPAVETPQTIPMDNPGLTLQALVWSEQPEDRFVVINDVIIREGGAINGSVVTQIESEYVTIRSGGSTWRLKHGH